MAFDWDWLIDDEDVAGSEDNDMSGWRSEGASERRDWGGKNRHGGKFRHDDKRRDDRNRDDKSRDEMPHDGKDSLHKKVKPEPDGSRESGSKATGQGEGEAESDKIANLEKKLGELEKRCERLEEEKAEAFNKMLLVKADSENWRKRIEKDKAEAVSMANKGLIADLLPGLDSIDVALAAISDDSIRQGIEMVRNSFMSALGKWGLELICPVGKEFDPLECEACMFEQREGIDKETVVETLQAGYILNGKVIRSAKVKIAKPLET